MSVSEGNRQKWKRRPRTFSVRTSTTTRTASTQARPAGRSASMAKTSPTTTTTDANYAATNMTTKPYNGEIRDSFITVKLNCKFEPNHTSDIIIIQMKQRQEFRDRFSDYLSRRMGESKKKELFRGEFQEESNSNKTVQLEEDVSHTLLLSPNSNISFNSSEFSSRFKSSSKRFVESSQPKKLRKLRELEDNQCAICLSQITNRVHLECKHKFCNDCLQQWLKNSSKCPYCRSEVTRFWFKGEEYLVQSKEFQYQAQEEQNLDWVCYQCDHTQDGDIVLICDRCEANACHIECDPSLRGREPRGDWFCHFCR